MMLLFLCILFPFLIVGKEPDTQSLTHETEKLICLIHLLNKKAHKIAHTASHFKEAFEKQYPTLQGIISDLIKLKDTLGVPQQPSSFTFIKRINSLRISSLGQLAALLAHELGEALERFNSLEDYTRQTSFYRTLTFASQYKKALNNAKEHLNALHNYLKATAQNSMVLSITGEEDFVKTVLTVSPTLSQFTERATLTLGALHNLVITQMEQIYNLQYTISIFEKEPTSIIDDTHEKKVTLQEKLCLSEKYFTDTFKALIAVFSTTVHSINTSFAFLQGSNTILKIPFPNEQEIETEVLALFDCLIELQSTSLPSS